MQWESARNEKEGAVLVSDLLNPAQRGTPQVVLVRVDERWGASGSAEDRSAVLGSTMVGSPMDGSTMVGRTIVGRTIVGRTIVGNTIVGSTKAGSTMDCTTIVSPSIADNPCCCCRNHAPCCCASCCCTGYDGTPRRKTLLLSRSLLLCFLFLRSLLLC